MSISQYTYFQKFLNFFLCNLFNNKTFLSYEFLHDGRVVLLLRFELREKQGLSLSRMPFRQSSKVTPMRIELILPKKSRLKLDASASSAIGSKAREWELHPHDYWLWASRLTIGTIIPQYYYIIESAGQDSNLRCFFVGDLQSLAFATRLPTDLPDQKGFEPISYSFGDCCVANYTTDLKLNDTAVSRTRTTLL